MPYCIYQCSFVFSSLIQHPAPSYFVFLAPQCSALISVSVLLYLVWTISLIRDVIQLIQKLKLSDWLGQVRPIDVQLITDPAPLIFSYLTLSSFVFYLGMISVSLLVSDFHSILLLYKHSHFYL